MVRQGIERVVEDLEKESQAKIMQEVGTQPLQCVTIGSMYILHICISIYGLFMDLHLLSKQVAIT